MPSQQTTLCQACGDLVPTADMPLHVARHSMPGFPALPAIAAFERGINNITGLLDVPPMQQTTICQACGDLVPTAQMPRHVALHAGVAAAMDAPTFDGGLSPVQKALVHQAIELIFDAAIHGAHLEVMFDARGYVGSLDAAAGTRVACAVNPNLPSMLVELAHDWREQLQK